MIRSACAFLGFRSVWDLLAFFRVVTLSLASVLFVAGCFAVSEMRQNGELVWVFSVRSIVRNRHALELANGDSWTFDTPFFWWQNLTGTAFGAPRLLGGLFVPTKRVWAMWIDPGRDTFDLLAAVAFMHRQYWRW
jgi:hypothetical protein